MTFLKVSWKSKYNLSLNYADFIMKQSVKNKISMRGLISELSAVKVVDFRTCSKPISATSRFTINREIRRDVTTQLFQRWPTEAIAAFPRPILTSTCRLKWVRLKKVSMKPPRTSSLTDLSQKQAVPTNQTTPEETTPRMISSTE